MYAIEFEAEIRDGMVRIPEQYQALRNGHARIVVLMDDESRAPSTISFGDQTISAFKDRDGLELQRELRDEW